MIIRAADPRDAAQLVALAEAVGSEPEAWLISDSRWRSVGEGSATMLATRGFMYWVIRLMVPPLPAASRPSKTTTTRLPSALTHSCTFTNSACRRNSSAS